jgi:hypothetical protein
MAELEREFRAQLDLARKKGVRVDYIDTHYIMPYHEQFRPLLERIGKSYGMPVSCLLGEHELDGFGIYYPAPEEKEQALAQILRSLQPGVHLLIGHPGYHSLENDGLVHFEPKDVQLLGVGRMRGAETLAYTSPRIKRLVTELGIKLMSYREFCNQSAGSKADL